MTDPNWYVVYTKPRCELKVVNILTKKNIKNYCPLHLVQNQWLDSRKGILEPVFTSYVFVCIYGYQMAAVLDTPGIVNFLYWLNKPATIPEDEINALAVLLKNNNSVHLEKCAITPLQTLQVPEDQRFDSADRSSPGRNRKKIILPSLGYCLTLKSRD